MAHNDEYRINTKEAVVLVVSWGAYAGTLLMTKDLDKAGTAKDAIETLGGIVSVDQKNSISGRVSELCKNAWDAVLKKYKVWNLRSELRDYNFAADPFHWDSYSTVCERVASVCKGKKQSDYHTETLYKMISKDVIKILGQMMDNDLNLKAIIQLSEIKQMLETLLIKQESIVSKKTIPTEGAFTMSHPIRYFGHEKEVAGVLKWIVDKQIIFIYGEGGIGKTEFCREVLAKAKNSDYAICAVNLIECWEFSQFIRRVAGVLEISVVVDDTPESIEELVLSRLRTVKRVLYLDNFEDVISEAKTEINDRRRVLDFLRKCREDGTFAVLVSSRTVPLTDFSFKELNLGVLDDKSAVSLFMELWGGEETETVRNFVLNDLYNYPLSIILAAKQKRYVSSIDELKKLWTKARKTIKVTGMGNPRHVSVETALSITYEEIKGDEKDRFLWELFTLFPESIVVTVAESIIEECYDARVKLADLSIIHIDGNRLSMLPLLREYIKETDEFEKDLPILSKSVLGYYLNVFEVDRRTERGSDKDIKAVESLSDVLYFFDCMVDEKYGAAVRTLHSFLQDYYWERPYESVEVLTKAVKQISFDDKETRVNIIEYLGDLEMRTDKLKEAEDHYREVETVYRSINNNPGLANLLETMGNLKIHTDELAEAERNYRETEDLNRQIHYDFGLANVLLAIGNLEMRTDKLIEAESHYRESEYVYKSIHDDHGLANVLLAMGNLQMHTDKLEEAEKNYREAENIYRRTHEDLGLANVLLAMGNLQMHTDKLEEAEKNYREAENIYRCTHEDLGLATVLFAMGNHKMRTDRVEEAEKNFRESEDVCRRIHYDLGLANVLLAMGNLEKRTDKLEEAEDVFRRIKYEIGLKNVLKMMGDPQQNNKLFSKAIGTNVEADRLIMKTGEYGVTALVSQEILTGRRSRTIDYRKSLLALETISYKEDTRPFENSALQKEILEKAEFLKAEKGNTDIQRREEIKRSLDKMHKSKNKGSKKERRKTK